MNKFLTIIALCALAQAAWAQRSYDFDPLELEDDTKWKEVATKLPAYPKPENSIEFDPGPTTNNRTFIDMTSIGVGTDFVVRFTLIVKSPQGAVNVSFEGMRCRTAERKAYGYGRKDGTWGQARNTDWQKVLVNSVQPQYPILFREFLCSNRETAFDFKETIAKLKAEGKPVAAGTF